ncbi:MAG: aspartate/glutamate racemase family protein [Rhizobiales bacterium]|nr:aspartate/glutamate racemase family protein [Hyphomicrobiales bacterium]
MSERKRIGILTPSSNTALEPITSAILRDLPDVTAHFSRFTVTEIALSSGALRQFDAEKILVAARLLADAKVDVICWSGTSAGWLGFESDVHLAKTITDATGIPATSAILGLNEWLRLHQSQSLGLVTPYTADVQEKIERNYKDAGISCISARPLGLHVNYEFAEVEPETLAKMIGQVATEKPDAIATYCTNLRAAHLAEKVEQGSDTVLLDTVSTTVWMALQTIGVDPTLVRGWGRIFSGIEQ